MTSGIGGNPQPTPDPSVLYSTGSGMETTEAQGLVSLGYVQALDGLSTSEQTELIAKAQVLLAEPQLPVGDQAKLTAWIDAVKNYQTTTGTAAASKAVILDTAPPSNPYMAPSIMALLYPVLSELQKVMSAIVLQSSKLDQAMIQLTLTMAKDVFDYTVAAGELRAQQLRQDAISHITQAVVQLAQAALTVGAQLFVTSKIASSENELKKTDAYKNATETEKQKMKMDNTAEWNSKLTIVNTLNQQLGGSIINIAQAIVDTRKANLTEEEATMNAMAQMLDKLMATIQQTQQKAIEEGKGASQFLQQFNDTLKDYAHTITSSLYA